MKKFGICLALTGLLGLGGQAFAEIGAIDAVPAATLLLPYFEVDLDGGDGVNTLFQVSNASAAPALAHVTLWTDWSQPTLDFDVFLTGYDVQTFNLYDIIANGNLPQTADEQNDGGDTISPHGGDYSNNPAWDGSFPNCGPFFPLPNIPAGHLANIQNGHTGQPVGAGCVGADHGDNIARGYITIDNVSACSTVFPAEPTYFQDGGTGIANNINQLWGDYFIVDSANDFAIGDTMVHIEGDDLYNAGSTATGYTFYGRYISAAGGADNREPLGTTWGARYTVGGPFDGTDMIVWRDSTSAEVDASGFVCGPAGVGGVGPSWHPLNETEVVAFNEAEDAVALCFIQGGGVISPPSPDSDPVCFPLETGRYAWGVGELAGPFNFGWAYLNLNVGIDSVADDFDPGSNGTLAQSHVTLSHSALGRYSAGLGAIQLTSAEDDVDPLISDYGDIGEP